MLHFKKMTLINFGPYKGEQEIDFTDAAGVSIFWGNNGRGKTTLLNAFRFGLFGVVQRRNGVLKNLSEMENSEAAAEGVHGFSVILEMTNDGDNYRLTRQLVLRSGVTRPSGEEDYQKSVFLEKNGAILSPNDRDHELNTIMPEQVSRFFLFDAELLQEYEELLEINTDDGDQIKSAIEKILGVPVIQNGVVDISDCLTTYDRQKSRAARADEKTVQLGQEMENLTSNIEEHQNIIKEKQEELAELIATRNMLEGRMQETEKIRKWILERNNAIKDKEKAESELKEVMAHLRELMGDAWKGMLLTTVRDLRESTEAKVRELESKKQKRNVAERFIIEMKKAISDRSCPVCGQDISADIIANLQKRIEESTSEYSGLSEEERQILYNLQAQLTSIRRLGNDVQDRKATVAMYENQKDRLQIRVGELQQTIDEMKDNIERYGKEAEEEDLLSLSKQYSDVGRDIADLKRGIEAETKKLQELKENKDRVAAAIEKQAGSMGYRIASRRYDLCNHLMKVFDDSKAKYRERLKENVEHDATELFVKLTGDQDYVGLKINDNYGLEIIHKSGRKVPGRSSGYEHIVALSLIGALHKNAPLRGPIIMDSPFGRLDPTHKANIVRALPAMAEQSILLAYTGEIDDQVARRELGSSLLKEFKLERVSSLHTKID